MKLQAELKDLFSGLVAEHPQTVGNMTVIPLCSAVADQYADVGVAGDLFVERDESYNSLVLATRAKNVTIVPQGMALITKEAAQDRAVPSTHLVASEPKQVGAFCVQSSQCGLMRKSRNADQELRLLPLAVRYEAYLRRDESADTFNSLWDKLGEYNRDLGVSGDFLVSFFRKYARDLKQFVAQFELAREQRGAVVLINDRLAGIEVAPNAEYFAGLFQPLIRDCYGAEALLARDRAAPRSENLLRDVGNLSELVDAVGDLAEAERKSAAEVVATAQAEAISSNRDHELKDLEVVNMESCSLVGQGVSTVSGKRMIYASLMAKPDVGGRKL